MAGAAELDPALPLEDADEPAATCPAGWVPWFLGAAVLAAVIVATLRFSEQRAFVRLIERAQPWSASTPPRRSRRRCSSAG
jgi:hypothetical protein